MRARSSQPGPRGLHLLEVGVQWPPEAFLRRKFEGLVAAGFRVTVASGQIRDDRFTLPGVELLRMAPSRLGTRDVVMAGIALAIRSPLRLARLVRNVARVPPALRWRFRGRRRLLSMFLPLANLRPDVIQFEWNVAAVDFLPLFGVWEAPIVTSCRGSDLSAYPYAPHRKAYAERLPEVMRGARLVHCVSRSLLREALDFGLDPAKARLITPAVDAELFRPRSTSAEPRRAKVLRVLAVGEARWEKGHEYALEAIRSLLDDGVPVELTLIGGGSGEGQQPSPEQRRISHTIADLGLERHMRLLPRVATHELIVWFSRADAFLHASLVEGIPNVVLEAMACGLPVVATDCGGVTEAVADGLEGYVVPPREPQQLAAALRSLWADPELRSAMGAAGRRRIRSGFSLATQIEAFRAMYHEVAA
jgi:colanic acid/amylovoran biosynthesis glycosyltransferase